MSHCPPAIEPVPQDAFERLVHYMRDGLLMLDGRGDAVAVNPSARSVLRVAASEKRVPAARLQRLLGFDPLETSRAAGRPLRMEFWVDGIPYQAELAPVEDGNVGSGCVMAFRDVREERRLDQMKSELINVASHELRTPLTAINNALDLLRSSRLGDITDQQRHFLELARRNVTHLMNMIDDLLDSAKLASGTARIEREPLDLGAVIAGTGGALTLDAEPKGITLTMEVEPGLPTVYGRASMLDRVLTNLIGNAIKFTPENGAIDVNASVVEGTSGRAVRVAVEDNGPGIPPDQLETIFDRFYQVGRAHGQEVPGTGLGLAIARELVEAHHGRIWAENASGGGARLVFTIPVLEEEEFLLQQLERELDRARRVPMSLTLVVVRLEDVAGIRERLGDKRFDKVLETLSSVAETTAYRSSDRIQVLNGRGEIAATLLDTPRHGGLAFARRLADTLSSELALPGARLVSGCATFPDEAVTAERLYQLAAIAESTNGTA